jgi:hypothetical protein
VRNIDEELACEKLELNARAKITEYVPSAPESFGIFP